MRGHRVAVLTASALLISLVAMPAGRAQDTSGSGVDLRVSVRGPAEAPKREDTFSVEVSVRNVGSEPANDVTLSTYIPEGLSRDAATVSDPGLLCAESEFGDYVCEISTLAPGSTASVTFRLTRVMARETWVDAWASTPEAELNYEDNYDGIYIEPDRSNPADLEVTISAPEQPDPGTTFDYTAVVTNRGPERARAVEFRQSLSELVDFVSVSSSDASDDCSLHEEVFDEEGIDGGPYSYREVRCSLGDMAFAQQTTITVTVTRRDPHELWSSAWVGSASFDDNYENDYADASTAGHPSVTSDLAMTLTRPDGLPLVGDEFEYTLSVTNLGPAPAPDVITDLWVPQELAVRSIVPARAEDSCEQNEYQGIQCTVGTLASGETASFTIAVTRVRAREFWMGGSVWSTNYDPNFENSYVEEQVGPDKTVPADVGVEVTAPRDPPVGSDFDYTMTVTNHGPMAATGVTLASAIPDGTDFVSWASSDATDVCTIFEESFDEDMRDAKDASYTYRELRCDLGTLEPSESASITMTVTRTTEYEIWNSAWVGTASYDENYDNDYGSANSSGKPYPGCGVPMPSPEGDVVACDTAGTAGRDSITYESGTSATKRVIRSGTGNDTVTVNVPTGSRKHRKIVVNAGRGNDSIRVLLAPGAGNVTVVVRGAKGRDAIEVRAPRPGKKVTFKLFGGPGRDTCESLIADRYRRRSC